ncbi:MAG: 2-keto-3-deoxy-D-arabino-heptulosonate-7-phosphate synthase I alpha (EC, partial [uncultured Caballeronia sp.]
CVSLTDPDQDPAVSSRLFSINSTASQDSSHEPQCQHFCRVSLGDDKALEYGKSVTDACLSWEDTVHVLHELARSCRARHDAEQTRLATA